MYHTLKTLYENQQAKNPDLIKNFDRLQVYCTWADEPDKPAEMMFLNRGYRSLKWLIYSLRDILSPGELQNLFHDLLAEAAAYRGEDLLYANIFEFRAVKPYRKRIPKPDFDIDDWPVKNLSGYRVLINTTTQNITNLVFRDDWADVILVKSPIGFGAVILSYRVADNPINLSRLFMELTKRDEGWAAVGNNLLVCGGPKAPERKTTISIEELINLTEKYILLI